MAKNNLNQIIDFKTDIVYMRYNVDNYNKHFKIYFYIYKFTT